MVYILHSDGAIVEYYIHMQLNSGGSQGRPQYVTPPKREVERTCDRYLRALIRGDEADASAAVLHAVSSSWSPATVYLDILAEALVKVGDKWHKGEITVAHEHHATQVTLQQMSVLRSSFWRSERTGLRAAVAAVERDGHMLGALIFADFLAFEGWDVDFLGAGTPPGDIARFVEQRRPDLLALSATLPEGIGLIEQCVSIVKAGAHPPAILLGGRAVSENPSRAIATGADAVAHSPVEALSLVQQMFNSQAGPASLELILRSIGEKIRALRTERGWSQQQLADASGLDRTYLSSVEHGRQNLTVAALKKLGDALGSPLSEFVS
jgi:methanogenic corrinoid protein MtbC1/DNA-binding XRE family transcriptional regulator